MFKEFKEFALKGNVVDMAIGIIIGAAFGTIVKSLVDDIIMPPLGLVLGKMDFTNFFLILKDGSKVAPPYVALAQAKDAGAVTLNYGVFLTNVVSFLIVAFVIFLVVRSMNKLRKQPELVPNTKECPQCCSAIPLAAKRCAFCTSELKAV